MRKDAKIALCVILALMVLVVIIWGRNPRPEDELATLPPKSHAASETAAKATPAPEPAPPSTEPIRSDQTIVASANPSPPSPPERLMITGQPSRAIVSGGAAPPDAGKAAAAELKNATTGDPKGASKTAQGTNVAPTPPPVQPKIDAAAKPLATHSIAKGDTYQSLARKYYSDAAKWSLIFEANKKLPATGLKIGQKLTIPALPTQTPRQPAPVTASARPDDAAAPPPSTTKTGPPRAASAATTHTYTVRRGQTFMAIAREVYHDPAKWHSLYEQNRARLPRPSDPNSLRAGTVLAIPDLTAIR